MNTSDLSVLISCNLSSMGGNETHVLSLSRLLAENGISVTVATRSNDFVKQNRGVLKTMEVRTVSTPFGYSHQNTLKNLWALLFWFRIHPFRRFTHLIAIGPGGFHRLLKRHLVYGGTATYWEAGDAIRSSKPAHLKMLASMDKISATSKPVAEIIERNLKKPVFVLPPLTSIPKVMQDAREVGEREYLRVIFLGRVSRLKGVDILIDIWSKLNIERVRLDLYGGGDELQEMKDLAKKNGLSDSFVFYGPFDRRKDLPRIMAQADLVVLPSLTEGLPHVLIEAMAYGVPFVATSVGGVSDLAVDNPDVMVVEPTREKIADGINEMVAKIRNGQISCERLLSYYRSHFSLDVVGDRWLNCLGLNRQEG